MRKLKQLAPIAVLAIIIAGCATEAQLEPNGLYSGNPFLYNSDLSLANSKSTLDSFVTFEYQNRDALAAQKLQAVTAAADAVRTNAPMWFALAQAARTMYVGILANQPPATPAQIGAASNSFYLAVQTVAGQAAAAKSIQAVTPIK